MTKFITLTLVLLLAVSFHIYIFNRHLEKRIAITEYELANIKKLIYMDEEYP